MIAYVKQADEKHYDVNDELVLSVNNVSKKFCRSLKRSLFYGVRDIGKEALGIQAATTKLRKGEFWALKDVSFQLRKGEALGLVGSNGAGKTSLLRIIGGLIRPDRGNVEVRGRVAPLIALGAGFNPILTGRENIYANMSILGLSKNEIDERFDEVVAFAELGEAIDTPVQSYSSGMAARLGFACAVHTKPDILLIDEVLAVGDVRFRSKCNRKLADLLDNGVAFILVSHESRTVLNVCKRSILLKSGAIIEQGNVEGVIRKYEKDMFNANRINISGEMHLPPKTREESSGFDVRYIFFRDRHERKIALPKTGEACVLCIGYEVAQSIDNITINLTIRETSSNGNITTYLSSIEDNKLYRATAGKGEMRVLFPSLGLSPNIYAMKIAIRKGCLYALDIIENYVFSVEGGPGNYLFRQQRVWEIGSSYSYDEND